VDAADVGEAPCVGDGATVGVAAGGVGDGADTVRVGTEVVGVAGSGVAEGAGVGLPTTGDESAVGVGTGLTQAATAAATSAARSPFRSRLNRGIGARA
jgi:hypothetical protein